MPLTNVTRGSIIDVSGVPDTPLKLVTVKSLKMNNNNVNNNKKLVKQSFGGVLPVGNVPRRNFSGGQFSRGRAFSWIFFPGGIFPDDTLLTNSP